MDKFKIDNVEGLTQRDNKVEPFVSCFPTSVGISMTYCLKSIGNDKTAIGCSPDMQIEDYINQVISSKEVEDWMKKNTLRLGSWIWKYEKRTIFAVEEYAFNFLMNPHGFKAQYKSVTYDELCDHLETHKLPCPVGGNFKSVSTVGGHIVCAKGFNKIGIKELIVDDPYGNALDGYTDKSVADRTYGSKFFVDGKGKINALLISRLS
jgi:hypothetical protein